MLVRSSTTTATLLAAALSLSSLAACSKQKPAAYGSSASEGPYALRYVDSLVAARQEIATIEAQVETARGEFAKYPDALSETNWADVKTLYEAADASGRSAAYVEELERSETVARFYVDEKEALNRKVGGAAQQAAKKKECDVELYGPTSYALGKGIEEQLEERLEEVSPAYEYLEEHEETLGKKNRPKLEEQIVSIARASYLAHVALAKVQERLANTAGEASSVDGTLDRVAKEAHARAEDAKLPAAERSKAKEREQKALAAKQRLEPEAAEAKKLSQEMDQRVTALRKKYEEAFDALGDAVDAKASAK